VTLIQGSVGASAEGGRGVEPGRWPADSGGYALCGPFGHYRGTEEV